MIQSFESFYGWKLLRDTMGRASGADPGQGGSWWTAAWLLFLAWMFWEQFTYQRLRWRQGTKPLEGPIITLPFLGGLVAMVSDPFKFWEAQQRYCFPGASCNWLLGKFMIFTTDVDMSRRALSVNDPSQLLMAVHPAGKDILGERNLAFMHGPPHKAIRKSFLALFTRKALGTYVELQDGIIRHHIALWLQSFKGVEVEVRQLVRYVYYVHFSAWDIPCKEALFPTLKKRDITFRQDMNAATSQEVFAGPYLGSEKERQAFSAAFLDMTQGFLAFPVCWPGTAVWKAKQGRLAILRVLTRAAAASKAAVQGGQDPQCLMDFWAQRCLEEAEAARAAGVAPPGHTSGQAMADTVMDFLFASQDASTASLVWMLVLLAARPDVLAQVREEQYKLRPNLATTITGTLLSEMTYTRQVVKEVLRYRPPAPMVPQVAQADFELGKGVVAPKGSLIMPSIVAATMQGFMDADVFDPDRFSRERQEDVKFQRNYLTFGCGPHSCVGREYAINHLTVFLALLSTSCRWTRRTTKASQDDRKNWLYLPTIYPADSLITFSPLSS